MEPLGAQSDKYRYVDLTTGGQLADILGRRRQGDSPTAIAKQLYDQYGVWVHAETIRRWCRDLGIIKEATGA